MEKDIVITVGKEQKQFASGSSLSEIAAGFFADHTKYIVASVNGKLQELFKKQFQDAEVTFFTPEEGPGRLTYIRGLNLLMLAAIHRVAGQEVCNRVRIEHSIGPGFYCEIRGMEITEAFLSEVREAMQKLAAEDKAIEKKSMNTPNALRLFRDAGMTDKEKLLGYRRVSKTNVYFLDGYSDYFYGYMPPSTGILKVFDLQLYKEGFVLLMPEQKNMTQVPVFSGSEKLYQTLREANRWCMAMETETVGELNDQIAHGNAEELILVQEALQEKKLAELAEQIKKAGSAKFIMIAGPSSSGKTTFSHRLSIQLRTLGYKPHPIGLDNYYKARELTPKDENGNYDFECLEALDVELFNRQMGQLLHGEEVELPEFNFKTGKPEYKGNRLKLGAEDILVIEGIHGLNDALSYSLPKESKFKVYISALTELNVDHHNRIPTTDGRLLRRIVRDARARGTSARDTIAMWPSVRRGEERYIFPFQEEADYMYNSALIYELAVLKQYAEPLLFGIPEDCAEYMEAKRLLKFLDYFMGIPTEGIPKNSILREFIGGSCFRV